MRDRVEGAVFVTGRTHSTSGMTSINSAWKHVRSQNATLKPPPEKPRKKIYPVKLISPVSAILYYEDKAPTLELTHIVMSFNRGGFEIKEAKARYGEKGGKKQ